MPFAATLDHYGKPAWIAVLILSFMVWWPVGLMMLAFMIGSRRMCGRGYGSHFERKMERMQWKMDRMRGRMHGFGWGGPSRGFGFGPPPSGNHAFDEYRTETLRRLEDEQREFQEFLERLRFAKDKSEFDQFMSERRDRPAPDSSAPQQPN